MNIKIILKALWNVRNGSPFEYQEAINFGIVIGMAAMLSYEQQVRLNILAKNAADHARKDRAAKRQAQKVAA
nr:hypothetical protein [Pseudomonas sp. UBA6718]